MNDVYISTPKDMVIRVSQYLLQQLLKCNSYRDNKDGTSEQYGFTLKVTHLLEEEDDTQEI